MISMPMRIACSPCRCWASCRYPPAPNLRGRAQPRSRPWSLRSPTCGCCGKWVDHVKTAGFDPTCHQVEDVSPVKAKGGVPETCSRATGLIAATSRGPLCRQTLIHRLLTEKPKIAGLAVPGMPSARGNGAGSRVDPYEVSPSRRTGSAPSTRKDDRVGPGA